MSLKLYEFLKLPEGIYIPFVGKYLYYWICKKENKFIRKVKLPDQVLNTEARSEKVIASLTSFPARIENTHLAIKSIMLQSFKPDEIILWLSDEQFKDVEIPKSLRELEKKGLQIKFCEDIRGHKKYFEPIKVQKPNELILTFDDDIIYPPDSIMKVMKYHKRYPNAIVINRGYEITFSKDGNINPHRKWRIHSSYGVKKPKKLTFISTGSGILIPYNSLYKDATDIDKIKKIALSIDDLWTTIMAILSQTDIVKTTRYHKTYTTVEGSQEFQLATENLLQDGDHHDTVLQELIKTYPQLNELLKPSRK